VSSRNKGMYGGGNYVKATDLLSGGGEASTKKTGSATETSSLTVYRGAGVSLKGKRYRRSRGSGSRAKGNPEDPIYDWISEEHRNRISRIPTGSETTQLGR